MVLHNMSMSNSYCMRLHASRPQDAFFRLKGLVWECMTHVFLTHLLIGEISTSDLHKGHSTQNPFCLYLWVAKGMIKNWCHLAHKSNKIPGLSFFSSSKASHWAVLHCSRAPAMLSQLCQVCRIPSIGSNNSNSSTLFRGWHCKELEACGQKSGCSY